MDLDLDLYWNHWIELSQKNLDFVISSLPEWFIPLLDQYPWLIYCVIIINTVTAFSIPLYFLVCRTTTTTTQPKQTAPDIIPSPRRYLKRPQQRLSSPVALSNPNENNDATSDAISDLESDILTELDRYRSTKGEKEEMEGLTSLISASTHTMASTIHEDQFERIQALEQELSNQKLLNHYTKIRLTKKEKECVDIQASEKIARNKIHQLMDEIVTMSATNKELITFAESKIAGIRAEYSNLMVKKQNAADALHKKQKEIVNLKQQISESVVYKNECSKLRANVSGLKAQIRDNQKEMDMFRKENQSLKLMIETQKQRLNDSSNHFGRVSDDLVLYKQENKRIKSNIVDYKDKVNELELCNDELMTENKDIKDQIQRFSEQLRQQSLIQNEIIDIQQTLANNKRMVISSSRGETSNESMNEEQTNNVILSTGQRGH
eukprot:240276_1